jgi:hypothetical protein
MTITRGRWILIVILGGSLTAAGALSIKRWPQLIDRFRKPKVTAPSPTVDDATTVPPFSTLEPERYRAIRVTTATETVSGANAATVVSVEKVLISRDGVNRREEYSVYDLSGTTVYLETSGKRFLLLPDKKIYTDLDEAAPQVESVSANEGADFSPDRLLHESSTAARYRKVGSEMLGDRKTSKYEVSVSDETSDKTETLVWVDDELGMPIKSETRFNDASGSTTNMTMELKDLSREVDATVFLLPPDFKKVDYAVLHSETVRARNAASKSKTIGSEPIPLLQASEGAFLFHTLRN